MQRYIGLFLVFLAVARPLGAQSSTELLALVPRDYGLCVAVNDLRGNWQRLEQASWIRGLKQSPLGQAILGSKEFGDLDKFERDLKQHLNVDWPTIRDDILGDTVVLAYRPAGPGENRQEHGLVLVRTRKPEVLVRLIDRLNDLQKKAGELQDLEPRQHQALTYHRRVHNRNTHFYFVHGNLFALASEEAALRTIIDRQGGNAAPAEAVRRAEAERALVALWLNPRAFDAELQAKANKAQGPEAKALAGFLAHWRALDAVVVSLDVKNEVDLRLSLLARPSDLPASAQAWFTHRTETSDLWQRFPGDSILTLAGRTDFRALAQGLLELAPAEARKFAVENVSKTIGAALGLDPLRDVLPNLGPNWGICVLPASAGKEFPQVLAALEIKPGDKDAAVDQAIYKALQFFAGLAVFEHNRHHADPIRIRSLQQDGVEVKYLVQDRLFPPGFQPACALKGGHLLLATSPAAIARFPTGVAVPLGKAEAPLMSFAPSELAQLLRHHRARVVEQFVRNEKQSVATANQNLDGLLTLLDMCRQITFSQRTGDGQIAWSLRFQMSDGKSRE